METKLMRGGVLTTHDRILELVRSVFTVSVDTYVARSLNTIGWTDNTNGCFSHWVFDKLADLQTKWILDKTLTYLTGKGKEAKRLSEKSQ